MVEALNENQKPDCFNRNFMEHKNRLKMFKVLARKSFHSQKGLETWT